MKVLGEYLREAREKKGLSLQEIQDKTKIRLYYLEAIENGEFEKVPGEVYLKGFLKNYAAVVGLDEGDVLKRYYDLKQLVKEELPTLPAPAPVPSAKRPSFLRIESVKLIEAVPVILLVLAVFGVFGWLIARHASRTERPVSAAVKQKSARTVRPAAKMAEKISERSKTAVLRLKATEPVWINLKDKDAGLVLEETTLQPGDAREWKIDRTLVLWSGNAGGLLISAFGEPFRFYGKEGEVVTTTFAPKDIAEQ